MGDRFQSSPRNTLSLSVWILETFESAFVGGIQKGAPKASDAAQTRLQLFGGQRLRAPFRRLPQDHAGEVVLRYIVFIVIHIFVYTHICVCGGPFRHHALLEALEDRYALQLLVTDSVAPEDNFRDRVWLPFDRTVLGARAAAAIRELLLGQRAQGQPWEIVAEHDSLQAPKLSIFHVRLLVRG